MKKFTFKGVLDGFRAQQQQPVRADQEIVETLRPDNFQVAKTFRHGFPSQPTAVAFDPIQRLLAVGTKTGSLRILGRPGVDAHVRHEGEAAVIQLQFLLNEGALLTATADDSVHLWNFRQKRPEVLHSLKFQRERITCMHLPLQSKWLYVGTERGNIHVVNIESFVLSGYVINWNKAIEVCRKTHPGPVVHLSDNPLDASKLLIGFESGQVVLWDLKMRQAELRVQASEPLRSAAWHNEGKQFMCAHSDGSLSTWAVRQQPRPVTVAHPHAKTNKDGKLEPCKPIQKVEWKSSRTGEPYVIFSGGLTYDKAGRTPSITVVHGKTTTVLEMEHNVVDFVTLCESPYNSDVQDPYAIVVVLQNDLVVIDLLSQGYPCFENPYPMDLHESPVTCCTYLADCPSDLIPAFYSVGARTQKRSGFSEREWPLSGGAWSPTSCSYNEMILTGHADGSVKFWDASAGTLQVLYKVKTAKVFEKPRSRSVDGSDDDPFAIQLISLCPESRKLCIAGASSHVILFKFRKQETVSETHMLEIPIVYETGEEEDCSPEYEYPPRPSLASKNDSLEGGDSKKSSLEHASPLRVRTGQQKKPAGFQAYLVCLTPFVNGEQPGAITALSINSSYGLMAYGNEAGLVIVDIVQRVCLMSMGTPDLYGSADPYQRAPRSPKRGGADSGCREGGEDRCRSPTADQLVPLQGGEASADSTGPSPQTSDAGPDVSSACASFASTPLALTPDVEAAEEALTALPPPPPAPSPCPLPAATERRRSSTWKGFNLKKQLSRVDQRLKNTFSQANNNNNNNAAATAALKDKRASVFYCGSSPTALATASEPQSPVDEPSEAVTPCSDDGETAVAMFETMSKAIAVEKDPSTTQIVVKSPDTESEPSEQLGVATSQEDVREEVSEAPSRPRTPTPVSEPAASETAAAADVEQGAERANRPADLPLFAPGAPVRPPRLRDSRRRTAAERPAEKRDSRLLSVPNIKYHHRTEHLLRDLRPREEVAGPPPSFGNLIRRLNKLDSSFSRSRSSSMSSLENISAEAIQCLAFADTYTKKSDPSTLPTLWVGTSLGSVLTIMISLPPAGDARLSQPVIVSPIGTIFRLKGCILTMSFLDCNGALIPYSFEAWRDENKEGKDRIKTPTKGSLANNRMSPTLSGQQDQFGDRQFVVLTSEKQARVVALPSHNCVYRQQLSDGDFVVKAEIISLKDSVCLVVYSSSGHVSAYSLPSLRPLVHCDFLPLADLSFQTSKQGIVDPMLSIWGQQMFVNEDTDQIARTFCFSNRGHGLYLCSPSEVQKFTVSADFLVSLSEMVGELFLPQDMPEPPKESFFKGLFGGGTRSLDREELFGEASGKASKSVAKHIPGPSANLEDMGKRAGAATSEISRAHQMMLERGEKLSQLEERTQRMASEAETFSSTAHSLMLRYKDKKWYQL